jgi:hypothetical protein
MQTHERTCGIIFSIQLAAKTTAILKTGISYKDTRMLELMKQWYPTLRIRKESCYKAMDMFAETFWRLRPFTLTTKEPTLANS